MTETYRAHAMPHGAQWVAHIGTRFRLWAPAHARIDLAIDGREPLAMEPLDHGWHERVVRDAEPGTLYRFRLPDGLAVPDPASRFQPEDVHGPSEVIDPTQHRWSDGHWAGRPWHETVLYELHVGTFTPEGTFRAAVGKLDHLVALGVNAVEVMPVGDFPGRRNWGYDGVLPYRARCEPTARPESTSSRFDRRRARLRPDLGVPRRRLQPLRSGRQLHRPSMRRDLFHASDIKTPWGRRDRLRRPAQRPGPRLLHATTRSTGSRSIASTASGSTPSTPSSIVPQPHLAARSSRAA